MIIGIPRESLPGETRVAATPQTIAQLIKLGYEVVVESGAGAASSFSDEAFTEAGGTVGSAEQVWAAQHREIISGLDKIPTGAHIPSILTAAGTTCAYADIWAAHALYNFLSTFSGTHFVQPRAYQAAIGFVF